MENVSLYLYQPTEQLTTETGQKQIAASALKLKDHFSVTDVSEDGIYRNYYKEVLKAAGERKPAGLKRLVEDLLQRIKRLKERLARPNYSNEMILRVSIVDPMISSIIEEYNLTVCLIHTYLIYCTCFLLVFSGCTI